MNVQTGWCQSCLLHHGDAFRWLTLGYHFHGQSIWPVTVTTNTTNRRLS